MSNNETKTMHSFCGIKLFDSAKAMHCLCVIIIFFISGNFYSSLVSRTLAYIAQALKKVPSSCLGQTDFLPGQIIFKFSGPMGKGLKQVIF